MFLATALLVPADTAALSVGSMLTEPPLYNPAPRDGRFCVGPHIDTNGQRIILTII
jgi:hypothetical protein